MADTTTRPALNRPFPILIIEDSTDYQFLIKHCLQTTIPQAKPTFILTGPKALGFLKDVQSRRIGFPKLVLLDIYLPSPETGWELLKTIRLDYPTLPVIVLSAFQDLNHIKQAYDLGAHSFLGKPSDMKTLVSSFKMLHEYWLGTLTLPPV